MSLFRSFFLKKTETERIERNLPEVKREMTELRIDRALSNMDYISYSWSNGLVYTGVEGSKRELAVLGTYRRIENGNVEVYYEDTLIAYISPSVRLVQFMLAGKYGRIKAQYEEMGRSASLNKLVLPVEKMVWPALKWDDDSGMIFDWETKKEVARFQGDAIGAVAAFALWAYDVGEDNKYSDYYNLIFK